MATLVTHCGRWWAVRVGFSEVGRAVQPAHLAPQVGFRELPAIPRPCWALLRVSSSLARYLPASALPCLTEGERDVFLTGSLLKAQRALSSPVGKRLSEDYLFLALKKV